MVETEGESNGLDVEAALKSTQYRAYLIAASELEKVTLDDLSQKDRIAFFLNVYQCMYIHHFIRMVNEGKIGEGQSLFGKLKSYVFDYSSKPFYYNISHYNFSLDEIKHGLIRGNKRSPLAYMKTLNKHDEKAQLLSDVSTLLPYL
jgi:Protein of unknown function, DUF547